MKKKINGIKFRSKTVSNKSYKCSGCAAYFGTDLCQRLRPFGTENKNWRLPKHKKGVFYLKSDFESLSITHGKVYRARKFYYFFYKIIDDRGNTMFISIKKCKISGFEVLK